MSKSTDGLNKWQKLVDRLRDSEAYADACDEAADLIESLLVAKSSKAVTLDACPPGLFIFNNRLGFKTEYRDMNGPEAYCVSSGEYFWGGTKEANARKQLMVYPIASNIYEQS